METEPIYDRTPYYNTRHQKWLRNIQNQVNNTTNFIANCLQENLERNTQLVTQHEYLKKWANKSLMRTRALPQSTEN